MEKSYEQKCLYETVRTLKMQDKVEFLMFTTVIATDSIKVRLLLYLDKTSKYRDCKKMTE